MLATKGMPRGHLAALAICYALLIAATFYVAMTRQNGTVPLGAIVVMIVILPMLLAASAKAPAASVTLPARHVTLQTALEPDAAFAKLAALSFGRVTPHDSDAARRVVVFSTPISGWSYGFFFPVFVRGAGAGSIVEVGVQPKSIDAEPRVKKALATCAAEIEKALAA